MAEPPDNARFAWHPVWAGHDVASVRGQLVEDARSDQRAYALALEGAERHENDALASTVALDRKWGGLSLDWAEADADALAGAMLAAEWEREQRQEMVPLAQLRDLVDRPLLAPGADDPPEKSLRLTDPAARRWVLLAVLVLVVLLVIWIS